MFFFFKQKTAYEMRISDWSSDVCSSDLAAFKGLEEGKNTEQIIESIKSRRDLGFLDWQPELEIDTGRKFSDGARAAAVIKDALAKDICPACGGRFYIDRKSFVLGKSVSVRVDLGGRRIIKKKKTS